MTETKPPCAQPSLIGRCKTCQFWIDAEAMEHVPPFRKQAEFNQFARECWAENPATVPADRRVKTGPYDLCRHWQLKPLRSPFSE